MSTSNDFESLRSLSDEVLAEIVREGEMRLEAQLQVAAAADGRALSVASFQIAAATASFGAGMALLTGAAPDFALAGVAMGLAAALLFAAGLSLRTVRPALFNLPGNRPHAWLPERWQGHGRHAPTLKQARIEQAACLDDMIADNAECARLHSSRIHLSLDITFWSVVAAGVVLTLLMMIRLAGGR